MNTFVGRLRVACGPSVDGDGSISSQKLLHSLNTLLSEASAVRQGDMAPYAQYSPSNLAFCIYECRSTTHKKAKKPELLTFQPLQLNDLEALFKMMSMAPNGPEARVNFEQFLKQISSLFANAASSDDGSEDANVLDILVAYRDLFNRIDEDHDGRIYPNQLHELVRGLTRMSTAGISRSPDIASTEMIVNHLDKAKKGYVDYVDFLAGALLSMDPPAGSDTLESKGDEDSVFMSAMGPSGSQHSSVFEEQMEMDSAPAPVRGGGNEASLVAQLKIDVRTLEQRLSTAQSELDKSEIARSELLGRLSEQDKQMEVYKKQLKSASELEQNSHRISDEMEQLRADLRTAKESLKNAAKLEAELKQERDRLREDLFQKGKELNDIEDTVRALRESATGAGDAKSQLSALQAQLAAQQDKYNALMKEKAEQDAAHAKLIEAMHELQAKHDLTLLEFDEAKRQYSDLSDEKNALTTSQAPRAKGSNLKAELTSVMRPMSPTKPVVAHDGLTSTSLPASSMAGHDAHMSSSVGSTSSLGIAANADELLQLRIERDMLTKEKNALLAHLSAADAKANLFEREKGELSTKVNSLSTDLTAAERAKASLQRQFADVSSELEDVKAQMKSAQDAIGEANAAAAKAAASQFARPEATITENELEELRTLRLSRREMEDQIAKLKAQTESDAFQIRALKNEVQQLRDLNRSLKTRLSSLPEETIPLGTDDDLRRGLLGPNRVSRHDKGCCDGCTIL